MYMQDFELSAGMPSDDMTASYLPALFDDFLVLARLRHRRPRTKTTCKIHSPIILRANTDMPARTRLIVKCLSMPNMTTSLSNTTTECYNDRRPTLFIFCATYI